MVNPISSPFENFWFRVANLWILMMVGYLGGRFVRALENWIKSDPTHLKLSDERFARWVEREFNE